MSEPNPVQNVEPVQSPRAGDPQERVDDQDVEAPSLADHGETDVESERIAQRPDF
jgi:hypothetical protein